MGWPRRCQMTIAAGLLAAALGPTPRPGWAEDDSRAFRLAQEKGCFECHAIGWKLVGPAFADIAKRYRLDPRARDMLADKLRLGGERHWGERFNMWPQTNLSDEEATVLAQWVLSQH